MLSKNSKPLQIVVEGVSAGIILGKSLTSKDFLFEANVENNDMTKLEIFNVILRCQILTIQSADAKLTARESNYSLGF